MKEFKDYEGKTIILGDETYQHIEDVHPELTLKQIMDTLADPLEVRESTKKRFSVLYYSLKIKTEKKVRYVCVVVKKDDKNSLFIETAMTTSNFKFGKTIYKKG